MPSPFSDTVLNIIKAIPRGQIMTYGQVAACAGSPRGARQVVRLLHVYGQKEQLPWHRVVDRHGQVAIKEPQMAEQQAALLLAEGVTFDLQQRIDLERFRWWPEERP